MRTGRALDLIESQVLNGLFQDAAAGLESLLQNRHELGKYLPVALFYRFWVARVQGRAEDAATSFAQ